ncbi:MAG: VTT domain-containing protein [Burkholderiales bacterium]|nr:VTT domain-containing protein [Burkholderiales bacterium]
MEKPSRGEFSFLGNVKHQAARLLRRPGASSAPPRPEHYPEPRGADTAPRLGNLFRPGFNCTAAGHAGRVALLVDGAAYYDAFMRAARKARYSILIVGWDFDSRTALAFDSRSGPAIRLGDFLNELAQARRRLHVRVLEWDYPVIFGVDRELSPIYGLSWKPHRRVHFRFDDTHPLAGSHHQKIVVIDDRIAFVGGLDLTSKRWDTPSHRPDDPGRTFEGKAYPPMHDVMAAIDGEAARALGDVVRARWLKATHERLDPVETRHDPWPSSLCADITDVHFAIACTAPDNNADAPVRHIEQLYLDMIARARRYIYIENQYFTSHKIAQALAARLGEPDPPQIVLVTRLLSHGWLEEVTMQRLRAKHVEDLRKADAHGRFFACYPHLAGLAEKTCIDTHSKLMIVDDEWLRVGSANLSNRSMGVDTECDLVIQADGLARVQDRIRAFRDRLLAEHLGAEPAEVERAIRTHGSMRAAIDRLGRTQRTLAELQIEPSSEAILSAAALADMEKPVSMEQLVTQLTTEADSAQAPKQARFPWVKLTAAVAIVAGLTALWRFTPLAVVFTAENVIAWTESFSAHWWAPLVVVLAYTPASVVMFPRPLITLAAVVSFGPWEGFVYAMTGVLIASAAGFYAGRSFGRDTVRRIAGRRLNRLSQALQRRGVLAVTAVRLVPLAPFIVESMVAGAIHLRLWQLSVGTFFGMLPGALTATVLGDALESALHDPARVNWWWVAGAMCAVVAASTAVARWLHRQGGEAQAPVQ